MKNFGLFIALIILIIVGAYYSTYVRQHRDEMAALNLPGRIIQTPTPLLIQETYTGTLPCADCEGLKTELSLVRSLPQAEYGQFILKEMYDGKNPDPYITTGDWLIIHGSTEDENVSIYELTAESFTENRYFLKVTDTDIRMLDSDRNEIQSDFNYTLTKID